MLHLLLSSPRLLFPLLLLHCAELVSTSPRSKRAFIIDFARRSHHEKWGRKWPSTTIRYRLYPSLFKREKELILGALNIIQHETCLNFEEAPDATHDVIVFTRLPGDSCMANVGKQDSWNLIRLGSRCFQKLGYILHEVMHALGFLHEHQRPDRAAHLRLFPDAVKWEKRQQFAVVQDGRAITEFDPFSVMNYESWLFSRDGSPTMEYTGGVWDGHRWLGQKGYLSQGDIRAINYVYCRGH